MKVEAEARARTIDDAGRRRGGVRVEDPGAVGRGCFGWLGRKQRESSAKREEINAGEGRK